MPAVAALLTLLGLLAAAPPPAPVAPPSEGAFAAAVRAAIPGFSGQIMVADRTDILFDRRFGTAPPVAVWPWGSVSKQVTAALVMRQIDAGRLKLSDRIADRLPDFPNPDTGAATVRQLLQHTAGLPNSNDTPDRGQGPSFYTRPGAAVGGRGDAYGWCARPRKGPAGRRFDYNNCDTIVIGAMLERVTGRPFADLLAEEIGRPLGLTSLHMARPGEMPVIGRSSGVPVPAENLATYGPAGAMIGSAADLIAFDRALIDNRLVSRAATIAMWQGEPMLGYVALGAWAFAAPLQGCRDGVRLVERRGIVGGVQARNIIAPQLGRMLVAFTDDADFDFGEIWEGKGASYRLASAAFCGTPPPAGPVYAR